jgi:hypothetical protein
MPQPRVFVLGDSITIQFGPYFEKAVAGKFHYDRKRALDGKKAEDDMDFPQGENGGDSSMCLKYLRHRREHDPIQADILLLNCGLHDIKTDPATKVRQVPLEHYRQNLRDILGEAKAMGLKVVWLRTAPVIDEIHNARSKAFHRHAADVERYNLTADVVMSEAGVSTIDLYGFCRTQVPDQLIDHVHYSDPARDAQAAFIARELGKLVE